MTAIRGYVPPTTDRDAVGVHSLDHFVLAVPDLKPAENFYKGFGLDVREDGNTLGLNTFGHDHRWGLVVEGKRKRLHHLSFGCYGDDLARLKARVEGNGVALLDPPAGFASNGFWFRDPSGVLIEVKVAPKSSPDRKVGGAFTSSATQHGGNETTLFSIIANLLHFGMVIVGLPYSHAGQMSLDEIVGGAPYGATTIAGGQGQRQPSKIELDGARHQGELVARTAARLKG